MPLGPGSQDGRDGPVLSPHAAALTPSQALATIADVASAHASEAALAGLDRRAIAVLLALIAETARMAGTDTDPEDRKSDALTAPARRRTMPELPRGVPRGD